MSLNFADFPTGSANRTAISHSRTRKPDCGLFQESKHDTRAVPALLPFMVFGGMGKTRLALLWRVLMLGYVWSQCSVRASDICPYISPPPKEIVPTPGREPSRWPWSFSRSVPPPKPFRPSARRRICSSGQFRDGIRTVNLAVLSRASSRRNAESHLLVTGQRLSGAIAFGEGVRDRPLTDHAGAELWKTVSECAISGDTWQPTPTDETAIADYSPPDAGPSSLPVLVLPCRQTQPARDRQSLQKTAWGVNTSFLPTHFRSRYSR